MFDREALLGKNTPSQNIESIEKKDFYVQCTRRKSFVKDKNTLFKWLCFGAPS